MILTVVFLVAGEWVMLDGWYPRPAPTAEICKARAAMVIEQLEIMSPVPFKVTCDKPG